MVSGEEQGHITHRNGDSEQMVCVDVTALFALARATGIQRVVRAIIGEDSEFKLVAFDSALGGYRLLTELPQAQKRDDSPRRRRIRNSVRFVSYLLWLVVGRLMAPISNTKIFQEMKRAAGRGYSRFLGEVTLPRGVSGPAIPLEAIDALWLLDIPKTTAHMEFLKRQVVESETILGLYVYDLIPVDSPELIDAPDRRTLVREYEAYLEIVVQADRLLCLSRHTLQRLIAYSESRGLELASAPMVVYPPMVQSMESARRREAERSTQISPLRIFGLAPLNRRKNLRVVLQAFRQLIRSGVDTELKLVVPVLSAVHFPTALLAVWVAIRHPNKVKLIGPVDYQTLVNLSHWADVVVVPSRSEGFGLPIVEALSAEKPVVASACTSFVELSEFLPIRLADPDDPAEWAEALLSADSDQVRPVNFSGVLTAPEDFRRLLLELSR